MINLDFWYTLLIPWEKLFLFIYPNSELVGWSTHSNPEQSCLPTRARGAVRGLGALLNGPSATLFGDWAVWGNPSVASMHAGQNSFCSTLSKVLFWCPWGLQMRHWGTYCMCENPWWSSGKSLFVLREDKMATMRVHTLGSSFAWSMFEVEVPMNIFQGAIFYVFKVTY